MRSVVSIITGGFIQKIWKTKQKIWLTTVFAYLSVHDMDATLTSLLVFGYIHVISDSHCTLLNTWLVYLKIKNGENIAERRQEWGRDGSPRNQTLLLTMPFECGGAGGTSVYDFFGMNLCRSVWRCTQKSIPVQMQNEKEIMLLLLR